MSNLNAGPWELDEFTTIDTDSGIKDYIPTGPTDAQLAAQVKLRALLNPEMAPPSVPEIEEYISTEIARNKAHGELFAAIMRIAFGKEDDVSIGHHLSFQPHGDISSLNEVPSADTLIFDHNVMRAVFGDNAIPVMQRICALPADKRDDELQRLFDTRETLDGKAVNVTFGRVVRT